MGRGGEEGGWCAAERGARRAAARRGSFDETRLRCVHGRVPRSDLPPSPEESRQCGLPSPLLCSPLGVWRVSAAAPSVQIPPGDVQIPPGAVQIPPGAVQIPPGAENLHV